MSRVIAHIISYWASTKARKQFICMKIIELRMQNFQSQIMHILMFDMVVYMYFLQFPLSVSKAPC